MNKQSWWEMEFTVMSPGLFRQESEMQSQKDFDMDSHRFNTEGIEDARGEEEKRSELPLKRLCTTDREKATRQFKWALVDYLKLIIKPYWKNGKLSKDAHNDILKKSADKVIKSFANSKSIPSSKGRIQSYLNLLHSKLSKLIEAYVEKYRKL